MTSLTKTDGERKSAANIFPTKHSEAPAHHVAAGPLRRTKSYAELIDGAEHYELFDRQFPGVLAVVRPT